MTRSLDAQAAEGFALGVELGADFAGDPRSDPRWPAALRVGLEAVTRILAGESVDLVTHERVEACGGSHYVGPRTSADGAFVAFAAERFAARLLRWGPVYGGDEVARVFDDADREFTS